MTSTHVVALPALSRALAFPLTAAAIAILLAGCGPKPPPPGVDYKFAPVVMLPEPGEKNVLATIDRGYRQRCAGVAQALSLDQIDVTPTIARAGDPINHSFTYTYCAAPGKPALLGTLTTTISYQGHTVVTDTVDGYRLAPGQWQVDARILIPPDATAGAYDLETRFSGSGASFRRSTSFRVQ